MATHPQEFTPEELMALSSRVRTAGEEMAMVARMGLRMEDRGPEHRKRWAHKLNLAERLIQAEGLFLEAAGFLEPRNATSAITAGATDSAGGSAPSAGLGDRTDGRWLSCPACNGSGTVYVEGYLDGNVSASMPRKAGGGDLRDQACGVGPSPVRAGTGGSADVPLLVGPDPGDDGQTGGDGEGRATGRRGVP